MKYKVGDKVRIKSLDWYNKNKDEDGDVPCGDYDFVEGMKKFCSEVFTISEDVGDGYLMLEDTNGFVFTSEMIECKVKEEVDLIPKFGEYSDNEPLDVPTMTTDFVKEHGLPCPEGYQFVDENGNVINTTKIVLEKKKKEYPKTYEECCKVFGLNHYLGISWNSYDVYSGAIDSLSEQIEDIAKKLEVLSKLLLCRAAYWKIAGEEMGLGKPWEPDWKNDEQFKYVIICRRNCVIKDTFTAKDVILTFPTAEMRDAFKENFKKEIEMCKKLL